MENNRANTITKLQKIKITIQNLMKKINVDSYTCVLTVSQKEQINTSNLENIAFEDISKSGAIFRIFYKNKRYIFTITGLDDLENQIEQIPIATQYMQDSEYYELQGLNHEFVHTKINNFIVPTDKFKSITKELFDKIKSFAINGIKLIDDAIYITNYISTNLTFNGNGFEYLSEKSSAGLYISLMADDGKEKYTSYDDIKLNADTNYLLTINEINDRITKYQQQITIPINKYEVIFHNMVSSNLLEMIVEGLDGELVWQKKSFLMEKIGQKIFNDNVNIIEDPCMPNSIYNSPVDMEGVDIYKKYLVQNGVVQTLLLDREYATKFKQKSTGNGWSFSIGYTNIYLEPGHESLEELIKTSNECIVIMETIGNGFNVNNGEISVCVKGLYYKDNKFQGTVNGTLSGNLIEIMQNIKIGKDIVFDSSLSCPSIKVGLMTFAPLNTQE